MKVWNYIILITTMVLFLQFLGIPNGASDLFNTLGINFNGTTVESVNFGGSAFWDFIFGSAGILIGVIAGLAIGFITKSNPENYIILPIITSIFVIFIQTFVIVINHAIDIGEPWVGALVTIILAPLAVGYIVAMVEFFRGTD